MLRRGGCSGIVCFDVVPEAITATNADAFLAGIIQRASHEIAQAVTAQGVLSSEFKILCDPARVVRVTGSDTAHTFVGLHGCQTLSFVVQMGSQELCRATLPKVKTRLSGLEENVHCQGMSCDMVCSEIRPDTSKCVLLPSDAPESFCDDLICKLEAIRRLQVPKGLFSFIAGPLVSHPPALMTARRRRLVLESSEEGLVDHALVSLWCYITGMRLVPDASLVWWFHVKEGLDFLKELRTDCVSRGVCMVIDSSSAVTFYGDVDSSKLMHVKLQNRLTDLQNETKFKEVVIAVTLPQLNRFVKQHGSLRAAAQAFSPNVRQILAARADGKWQLTVTASPEGVKSVRDSVLVSQVPDESVGGEYRYECLVCFKGSNSLDDDWLVSLACGCILHVPCARLNYGCDEGDALQPLKPKRLFPLDCLALDSTGNRCGKQLAQLDIAELVQDPAQLQRRVTEELTRFASIPASGWRTCPDPAEHTKCQMLYRTVPKTQSWSTRTCEGCGFQHCASCEGAPHALGMSCREAVGDIVQEDAFANLDPQRCANTLRSMRVICLTIDNTICRFGRCPTCAMPIERAEACSHIICTRCNRHFNMQAPPVPFQPASDGSDFSDGSDSSDGPFL